MFQSARRLFHLPPANPVPPGGEQQRAATGAPGPAPRHPAMRGLNVPPVHGRHCICDRCSVDRAA